MLQISARFHQLLLILKCFQVKCSWNNLPTLLWIHLYDFQYLLLILTLTSDQQPLQVARCTKIINPGQDDAKYVINVKQFAKFVVSLSDQIAPTDIEEGMRVGYVFTSSYLCLLSLLSILLFKVYRLARLNKEGNSICSDEVYWGLETWISAMKMRVKFIFHRFPFSRVAFTRMRIFGKLFIGLLYSNDSVD